MALPADTFLTLDQLNKLFQTLTINLLGYGSLIAPWEAYLLNPVGTAPTNPYSLVRVSWPTDGQPAWGIADDVAFIRVEEVSDPYNQQRVIEQDAYSTTQCDQVTTFTRVLEVFWVLCGPNSFDYSQNIRDKIFYQANHETLSASNVYIVPNLITPRRVPELLQGQWWQRTDFSIRFNEKIVRNLAVSYIQSADITVSAEGDEASADVTSTTKVHGAE